MANNNQSALPIGTVLNSGTQQYRIERVLGAGSFGITYLASTKMSFGNIQHTIKVAIKEHFMDSCYRGDNGTQVLCTPTSKTDVEQSRDDFLAEARRLQSICTKSHSIVHVNETFESNGTAYYVMEYLDGGNPKQMPEQQAIALVSQLAEAIAILHDNRLLHLDIKPDNVVMKTDDNGTPYPVIIDFGIAKHFDGKGNPTSRLQAKGASSGYAPIEQYDTIKEFSPKYDIYALGGLLLYLLTGKNPPDAFKVLEDPTVIDSMLPADISASTRTAIKKAMSPSAALRTSSVREFINELYGTANAQGSNTVPLNTNTNGQSNTSGTVPINRTDTAGGNSAQGGGGNTQVIGARRDNKNWFVRHKVLSIICASVIALVVLVAVLFATNTISVTVGDAYEIDNPYIITSATDYADGKGYVDLGLSVKWATCNIGAANPWEIGNYYEWANAEKREAFKQAKLEYSPDGDSDVYGAEYDIATNQWGSNWRMPTFKEMDELCKKCHWKWSEINGITGMLVTGPNGNRIFLPATDKIDDYKTGEYWTSTVRIRHDSDDSFLWIGMLNFGVRNYADRGEWRIGHDCVFAGPNVHILPVRPVYSPEPEIIEEIVSDDIYPDSTVYVPDSVI